MGDTAIFILTWLAVVVHATVGLLVARRFTVWPLVPVLNGLVALGVLAYWVPRWISYATQGIIWYVSDQAVPLYALIVLAFSVAALTGRVTAPALHWVVFGIDLLVLLAAALFFTFFRMDRLI